MSRISRLPNSLVAVLATALLTAALVMSVLLQQPAQLTADPRFDLPPLQAPGEWFDSQRAVGADGVSYADTIAQSNATPTLDAEWELLGPTNIGGRANDVVLVPGRPNEVWAATASGGVWHSADFGETYEPRWDPSITPSIGAMASDADGVLYVGTGEANPGGGSIVYGGTGMYVSNDLGDTWEFSGLPDSGAFGRIQVASDGTVYAAASGNLFVPGGQRGLYASSDKGQTWDLVFDGNSINATTGATDVAIDPSNPDRILVAMWDHYRSPEERFYAGPGSGVYLSEDKGATWTRIDDITLSADPNPNDEFSPADEVGRIAVAFAPSDPSRVYAMIANTLDGTHGAWFTSNDGGLSFTESNPFGLAANNSSYGWWFSRIFVDPLNADHLFPMGLEVLESLDGGETFVAQSNVLAGVVTGTFQGNVHADQHGMAWSPDVPGLVYIANDGGVYRNTANGAAGSWLAGVSMGWTQHYSVDVDEQTATYVVSGLQDNLCQNTVAGTNTWAKYGFCGDGIVTRVDPADPSITFYCSQYGGCGKATAGAPDLLGLTYRQPNDERYGWLADIQFDPNDSEIIYTAGTTLWRTTNGGTNFVEVSGDLSSDPVQTDPNSGYRLRGVVTTIATHPNSETIWVGTDEGRLWVNHEITGAVEDFDNETWTLVDDGDPTTDEDNDGTLGLPERTWITSVTADPTDPTGNTAYVAYSGFRQGDNDSRLFVTRDGGQSFTAIDQGLPGAPINDIILIEGAVPAVGTDVGVFVLTGADGWERLGDLPTVPVLELRHHSGTNTLTAATFGHGVQRVDLPFVAVPASVGAAEVLTSITG